jgi:hypothetical protein
MKTMMFIILKFIFTKNKNSQNQNIEIEDDKK